MKSQPLIFTGKNTHRDFWSYGGNEPPGLTTTGSAQYSGTLSKNGFRNFDWQDTIRLGLNATSAYSTTGRELEILSRQTLSGAYEKLVNGKKVTYYDWYHQFGFPVDWNRNPTFLSNNARNSALSKFYRRLENVYQQFDGLTFLGELTQTRRAIVERASDLLKLMLKDHRRIVRYTARVRGGTEKKRFYSQRYLEATFTWAPLFSDIENFLDAFDEDAQRIVHVRGTADDMRLLSDYEVGNRGVRIFTWYERQVKTEAVRYWFVAAVRPAWDLTRMRAYGISLRNVPLAAYELTPWSFVVDYFVDIQSWLRSRVYSSVIPIYSVESILQTRDVEHINRPQEGLSAYSNRLYQSGTWLHTRSRSYTFQRKSLGSLPQMKGPHLRGIPSARQLLNLTALFAARSDFINL